MCRSFESNAREKKLKHNVVQTERKEEISTAIAGRLRPTEYTMKIIRKRKMKGNNIRSFLHAFFAMETQNRISKMERKRKKRATQSQSVTMKQLFEISILAKCKMRFSTQFSIARQQNTCILWVLKLLAHLSARQKCNYTTRRQKLEHSLCFVYLLVVFFSLLIQWKDKNISLVNHFLYLFSLFLFSCRAYIPRGVKQV